VTDTLARALATADDHTLDRRKLLKVGAWAAPVVVLAAAVPAASASGAMTLSFEESNFFYTSNAAEFTGVGAAIKVKLAHSTGSGGSVNPLTMVVKIGSAGLQQVAPTITGSGWTGGAPAVEGDRFVYTFTYAGGLTAGGSTSGLLFTVPKVATAGAFVTTLNRYTFAQTIGTAVNASVSQATTQGEVGARQGAGATPAVIPAQPEAPGSSNKDFAVTVVVAANASVVALLTVTNPTGQDVGFGANGTYAAPAPGGTVVSKSVARSTSQTAGKVTFGFPSYAMNNASSRTYKIEFFLNGSAAAFAPATITRTVG